MRRLICLAALVILCSCGAQEGPVETAETEIRSDTLRVFGTIGELMGDSLYVFGEITSAEPVPEGVAVLDIHTCRISFYDPSGVFIRQVGGRGEGPGEFLLPIDFAVLEDGRIAVADLTGRKIVILSPQGELVRTLSTDSQILPYRMDALSDSSFFVYYYSTEPFSDQVNMGYRIELWNTSGFQEELWSAREDYDGSEYRFAPGYAECCSGFGGVLVSEMECPDMRVSLLAPGGGSELLIDGEGTSVQADTTDLGYDEMHAWVTFTHDDTVIDLAAEPLEFRPQVGAMGVDAEGTLWLRRGTVDGEEWLLYSGEGELIGSGTIQGIEEPGRLRYVINAHGAVAWAPYTEDYPMLYLLSRQ